MLEQACAAVAAELEGIEVERWVRNGPAANVLCDASNVADMLVVGSRGLGGFTRPPARLREPPVRAAGRLPGRDRPRRARLTRPTG